MDVGQEDVISRAWRLRRIGRRRYRGRLPRELWVGHERREQRYSVYRREANPGRRGCLTVGMTGDSADHEQIGPAALVDRLSRSGGLHFEHDPAAVVVEQPLAE